MDPRGARWSPSPAAPLALAAAAAAALVALAALSSPRSLSLAAVVGATVARVPVARVPTTPPGVHGQPSFIRSPNVAAARGSPSTAERPHQRSPPTSLPAPRALGFASALAAAASLALFVALRAAAAAVTPRPTAGAWAALATSAHGRRSTTRAAAASPRDDFDPSMLRGSTWGSGDSALAPRTPGSGLAPLPDDVPPTDNSGFDQAGGFGWNDSAQGYTHIERRMRQRTEKQLVEMAEKEKSTRERVVQEVTERRANRVLPTAADLPQAVLDYLLSTVTDDLAFEIARLRPLLAQTFDDHLAQLTAEERRKEEAPAPDDGSPRPVTMLRNYEVLRRIIDITFRNIDAAASVLTAPKDRLKKLLGAKDKKAMILEMVAANEVDPDLLVLLKTNQADAQVAGATQVAEYLGKLHDECQRFANLSAAP